MKILLTFLCIGVFSSTQNVEVVAADCNSWAGGYITAYVEHVEPDLTDEQMAEWHPMLVAYCERYL